MKKFLLILSLMFGVLPNIKAEYLSMQFSTIDGEQYLLGLEGLEIVYTNESLLATQGLNRLELPLSKMASMNFSSEPAAIHSLRDSFNDSFEAYDLKGVSLGIFESMEKFRSAIPEGIYILKTKDGSTIKISIEK